MFRNVPILGLLSTLSLAMLTTCTSAQDAEKRTIEFNRDIRPILSENCFVCHGPDDKLRKGDLRLDTAKGIYDDRGGYKIIDPKNPQKSELLRRILSKEKFEHMPPAKSKKSLDNKEIALLQTWIKQGGTYQGHWAFLSAKRPKLPEVKNKQWVRNPIDQFVLRKLEAENIQPSPEADRITLIRRLSFDLTGLPPTPDEVSAFVKDKSEDAYEKLVDRLLKSPHFGERLALYWLDVVRYADTGGYHSDNHRDVWLYRDWVINAFNENKPFDDFLTEQLAGDLLPNATDEQRIASGFNRLLQTTEEGGAQPKEYSAKYQADRVRNTGSIFLGLTLGCAECHDHKFDPIKTRDFYEFAAFFADIQERAVGRQPQTPFPTSEQQAKLKELGEKIAVVQKDINAKLPEVKKQQTAWEKEAVEKKFKGIPGNIANLIKIAVKKRNGKQKQQLDNYYRTISPRTGKLQKQLQSLQSAKSRIDKAIPTTLVSVSGKPRTVRILPRGNWLDDSGEIVSPAVPDSLDPPMPSGKKRLSRLDLANWMTAEENPLTARVFVNRLWLLYFGEGIVRSPDDFGSQGTWPTHPELLDWLAVEFRDNDWNMHKMIKLMVTSSTYRQTSAPRPELKTIDPYNKLLARQASSRLEAEFVRDNALAISGLLVRKIGGPSVKPYQPAGYWQHLNFPRRKYSADKGDKQYRRGLYTYWQRTFLHPSLMAFDAPSREECTVQRPDSNTPQQALVLLNDPTYVEAARVFAEKILAKGGKTTESRIQYAYRWAVSRPANQREVTILSKLYENHLKDYRADPKAAQQLLQVGLHPTPKEMASAELAAWTSVTRVILNLHETITRN